MRGKGIWKESAKIKKYLILQILPSFVIIAFEIIVGYSPVSPFIIPVVPIISNAIESNTSKVADANPG